MKYLRVTGYITIMAVFLAVLSCNRGGRAVETSHEADSINITFHALEDSLSGAWEDVSEAEEERLEVLRGFAEEMAQAGQQTEDYRKLKQMVDTLETLSPDHSQIGDTGMIRRYDSIAWKAVEGGRSYAAKNNSSNSEAENWDKKLSGAHEKVYRSRLTYDSLANLYNEFIRSNRKILIESDRTRTHFDNYPVYDPPAFPPDPGYGDLPD